MGRRLRCLGILCAALLGAGCAATTTSRNASALADAGVAYGTALVAVVDLSESTEIDARSRNLLEERSAYLDGSSALCGPTLTPSTLSSVDCAAPAPASGGTIDACANLVRRLHCADEEARHKLALNAALRAQIRGIGRYFAGLKGLASYDAQSAGGTALKGFAGAINDLTRQIRGNPLLTNAQVDASEGLGKQVADAYKSAVIREVLRRDADDIDRALAWEQTTFTYLAQTIEAFDAQQQRRQYFDGVVRPFLVVGTLSSSDWVQERRSGLTPKPEIANLKAAADAAQQLREIWGQIIAGSTDPSLLLETLGELQALADSLAALRAHH